MESDQTVKRKIAIVIGPSESGTNNFIIRLIGYYSFVGTLPTIGIDSKRINLSYNNDQYFVDIFDSQVNKDIYL